MAVDVWTFRATRQNEPNDPDFIGEMRKAVEQRGWRWNIVRERESLDSSGKPLTLVKPETATNLYRGLHSNATAVLFLDSFYVRLNPTRHVRDRRSLSPLNEFVRYKAFCSKVSVSSFRRLLAEFENSLLSEDCDGDRDPRVLPMHIFAASTVSQWDLASNQGRADFEAVYGGPKNATANRDSTGTPMKSFTAGVIHNRSQGER